MDNTEHDDVEGDEPEASDDAYQSRDLSALLSREPRTSGAPDEGTGEAPAAPTDRKPGPAEGSPADEPAAADAKDAPPASDDGPANWREARTALKSVTERNKELERQIADLTRKVMSSEQPRAEQDIPDPLIDQKGFTEYLEAQRFTDRVELTRELMIDSVGEEKFAAAEAAFIQAAAADPKLGEQLRRSPNPAKFAYQAGSKMLESRADPVKDREALEAEITAKVLAKLGIKDGAAVAAAPTKAAPRTVTPTSLADARSVAGPAAGPQWEGPRPLSSLIGRRR